VTNVADIKESEAYLFLKGLKNAGVTYTELYDNCEGYAERSDLSRDLNRLIQSKLVQKRGTLYWDNAQAPTEAYCPEEDASVATAKKKVNSSVPAPDYYEEGGYVKTLKVALDTYSAAKALPCEEPEPDTSRDTSLIDTSLEGKKVKEPLRGNLQRSKNHVKVALLFYYHKDEKFTFSEITALTGVKDGTLYPMIKRLLAQEYIYKTAENTFHWTSRYTYPFSSVKPEDSSWATLTIIPVDDTATKAQQQQLIASEKPQEEKVPEVLGIPTEDLTLAGIDSVIARYEMEMASLKTLRQSYVDRS